MLAIGVSFLGLGLKNVLLALIVLAVPPIITNAYVAVDQVDRGIVDAARGMGMTGWQILSRVELPLADPAGDDWGSHRGGIRRVHDDDQRALTWLRRTASAKSSTTGRAISSRACSAQRSASQRWPCWSTSCSRGRNGR